MSHEILPPSAFTIWSHYFQVAIVCPWKFRFNFVLHFLHRLCVNNCFIVTLTCILISYMCWFDLVSNIWWALDRFTWFYHCQWEKCKDTKGAIGCLLFIFKPDIPEKTHGIQVNGDGAIKATVDVPLSRTLLTFPCPIILKFSSCTFATVVLNVSLLFYRPNFPPSL